MAAPAIVEAIDVVDNLPPGLGTAVEGLPCHQFLLQGRRETLDRGIVPAVASPAHADGFSVQAQCFGTAVIFADGFESGDSSAWSSTVQWLVQLVLLLHAGLQKGV